VFFKQIFMTLDQSMGVFSKLIIRVWIIC